MLDDLQPSTSDEIDLVEVKDAPIVEEQAKTTIEEETPETVTLTKAELQEQKNAVAKRERERSERKSSREMQALRAEFEAYKAPPPMAVGKPTLDKFESYDDFTEALTDWKLDQRESASKQVSQQAQSEQKFDDLKASFAVKQDEFRKSTPDYDDVVYEIEDYEFSNNLSIALLESDSSPAILHYLATNLDELDRLNSASVNNLNRALGRLEEKLATTPKTIKPTSNAPTPITPLGSSRTTVTPDATKMTDAEWNKHEEAKRYKKG